MVGFSLKLRDGLWLARVPETRVLRQTEARWLQTLRSQSVSPWAANIGVMLPNLREFHEG